MNKRESGIRISTWLATCVLVCAILAGCSQKKATLETTPAASPAEMNQRFADPDLDVDQFIKRWENDNRDVYHNRDAIVNALNLSSGDRVADIGAGTGAFVEPIARKVGMYGFVYAVDIAQPFLNYIHSRAKAANLVQVKTVLGTQTSTNLSPRSIDVAFCCNTYHHFENPPAMLASIRSALRDDGEFVVVDFDRVEGVSREWILEHIRFTKAQAVAEIEQAGFQLAEDVVVPTLSENFMMRFVKIKTYASAASEPRTEVRGPSVVAP